MLTLLTDRDHPPPEVMDPEEWERAKCKGQNFVLAFDQPGGSMPFMNRREYTLQDTKEWSYKIIYLVRPAMRNLGAFPGSSYGIATALRGVGKSDRDREDGGKITVCDIAHTTRDLTEPNPFRDIDQQEYHLANNWQNRGTRRVTGSVSTFGFSVEDGVIINLNIKSSVTAAKERNPPVPDDQLPDLRALSDLQWAVWSSQATPNQIHKLEYYFVASIQNKITREIIRVALWEINGRQHVDPPPPLKPWPGDWIPIYNPVAQAILGSPIGKTLGYFLTQHKAKLGNLWVDGVYVFHGDTSHKAACLAFHISQPEH